MQLKRSLKVFISYAHEDHELRRKLEQHLSGLKYSGEITIWQDQEIPAGANWEDQINTHLNQADLILLLISANFIASKYCWSKEVKIALERHKRGEARVIPIILKPVHWQDTPLGQLQALPTSAKPVTRWNDQDEAFEDVVRGLRKSIRNLYITLYGQQLKSGNEHSNAKDYIKAIETLARYEQAIRLNPNRAFAYYEKAHVLNVLERYEEALEALEQALDRRLNSAGAFYEKGYALRNLERYEEALEAFEQALLLDPNSASPYQGKSNALEKLGRQGEAELAHEKARQLGDND
jgi:tetratricopeptide (TPR) repeat protein